MRPSTGILAPDSSITINVVLQSGPNVQLLLNKDKFLVMCMEVPDLGASQQDITDLWKVNLSIELNLDIVFLSLWLIYRIHITTVLLLNNID